MPGPPARIRSGILVELSTYCAAKGLKLAPLIRAAGFDPQCLDDPNRLVPLNAAITLFDDVARALRDPYFGVNFATHFKPGASGMAGALIISAPTVREALTQLARLVNSYSPQVTADFVEKGGVGYLRWAYPDTITAPRMHYGSFAAASVVMRVREGTGLHWCPLAMEFDHRPPADLAPFVAIFGERLSFEMPANRMTIDGPTLGRAMKSANPAMFALAIDLAERWIESETNAPSIARDVRAVIAAELKHGTPTLDAVAGRLGLKASQLQWRLEQEATSFERVLNGMRADMAMHLLENTDRSITDIAFALGFTDPSTFSRAARRWFSDTPLKIRRKARRGEPVQSAQSMKAMKDR